MSNAIYANPVAPLKQVPFAPKHKALRSTLGLVAEYEARLKGWSRSVELPVPPNEPTPEVPMIIWRGEASDKDAAIVHAREMWRQQYGSDPAMGGHTVEVKEL